MKIVANNINGVFNKFIELMDTTETEQHNTREDTITEVIPTGLITVYEEPTKRVLFNKTRKVNPRYQLLEALWVLAGRQDVAFLSEQLPLMKNFSDDGKVFHGAYGYRLRHSFGFDQITKAVELLKANPASRQVVMSIWNPALDLGTVSKDIPCNNYINLYIHNNKLELHITARSNDMMTGAYGVNVVQFSMLQEYMANAIGVEVGKMVQHSNNAHVYLEGMAFSSTVWSRCKGNTGAWDLYKTGVSTTPLLFEGESSGDFDDDLYKFFDCYDNRTLSNTVGFKTLFFQHTILPMYFRDYKSMLDGDWKLACKMLMSK